MDEHGAHRVRVLHLLEDGAEVVQVVAVDGADVVQAELLKEGGAAAADHAARVLVHLGGHLLDGLRQLLGDGLRRLAQLAQRPVGLEAREGGGEAPHGVLVEHVVLGGQRHLLVVVEDDDHVRVHEAGVVHRLIRHTSGDGTVADDCNDVVLLPLEVTPHGHAQACRDGCGAMAGTERVVLALRALCERSEPIGLAESLHLLAAAGENLVGVRLVTHVPDDLVLGQVENLMQSHCELNDAQAGPKMTSCVAHVVDHVCTEFLGQLVELRQVKVLHVNREVDGVQEGGGRLNVRLLEPIQPQTLVIRGRHDAILLV
mmetsp:Transcript_30941/g.67598  ORF Transcript_30941/g.67598 Transcript_30941/m.67598 type:complete len:315 (-) Transcript_30941:278-1222(-)